MATDISTTFHPNHFTFLSLKSSINHAKDPPIGFKSFNSEFKEHPYFQFEEKSEFPNAHLQHTGTTVHFFVKKKLKMSQKGEKIRETFSAF